MPQSYTCLFYHLVFSTKHREPTITPDIRPRLYDYLGGLVRAEGGDLVVVSASASQCPTNSFVSRSASARLGALDCVRCQASNTSLRATGSTAMRCW